MSRNNAEELADEAITAIKAALEAKDEPVAYIRVSKTGNVMACAKSGNFYALPDKTLLYTTPPQRKPLTVEEIEKLIFKSGGHKSTQNLMSNPMQVREHIELWNERIYAFARAIEAAHGIKDNT